MHGAVELSCDTLSSQGVGTEQFLWKSVFPGPKSSVSKGKPVVQRQKFLLPFLHQSHFYWTGGTSCKKDYGVIEEVYCVWKEDEGLNKGIPCVKTFLVRRSNATASNVLHLCESEMLGKLEYYMIRTKPDICFQKVRIASF